MTSSQAVRFQELDAKLEEARKAGDFAGMQRILGELTSLRASIYGRPKQNAGP